MARVALLNRLVESKYFAYEEGNHSPCVEYICYEWNQKVSHVKGC